MKYYLTEAGLDVSKITPEDWRRLFSRGDTRVPQTRNPIRKPASTAKPKPKPVQKEFTFEEKKRTLLQRFAAWVQPSGPRVKVPRDMTTDQRERAYKRFRRTALSEVTQEYVNQRIASRNRRERWKSVKAFVKYRLGGFRKPLKGGDPLPVDAPRAPIRGTNRADMESKVKDQFDDQKRGGMYQLPSQVGTDYATVNPSWRPVTPFDRAVHQTHQTGLGTPKSLARSQDQRHRMRLQGIRRSPGILAKTGGKPLPKYNRPKGLP
jgi:hypothetical protein|tara:strand:+ start:206 stop:997 length:792 start_codon:yes stop_codon:yes gene_type:complete